MHIDILGTLYSVSYKTEQEDSYLKDCNGYVDKTSKRIVINDISKISDLNNPEWFMKKSLRREIIHAFLFESGLHENWEHNRWGQEETTVDYFAIQWSKIHRAFVEAGAI